MHDTIALLSLRDSIVSANSFRPSNLLFVGFEDFRGLFFATLKDCMVSHVEDGSRIWGGLTGLCMRGRNTLREGIVLRLALQPRSLTRSRQARGHEGAVEALAMNHVTSRKGKRRTGGLATWRTVSSPTVQQSNSPTVQEMVLITI